MLVHQIVELNARKTPNAIAISDDQGGRYTWDEFDEAAKQMAEEMLAAGVRPGDTVALLARNCCNFYVTYIAASKVGGAFAPINYRFAPTEVTAVLRDSRPTVVILEDPDQALAKEIVSDLPDLNWRLLAPDLPPLHRQRKSRSVRVSSERVPSEDDISLVCYTGGSSGRSKGVRLSHRNMFANAYNWTIHDEIRRDDVYLAAGALFHIGVAAPFAFWLAGARCVVMNFEPCRALDLMEEEGVTKLVASGTIFKMLVDEQELRPRNLALRRIDSGAAPVPLALIERARQALGCQVGQIYGQTESCFSLTYLYPEEYEAGAAPDASEVAKRRIQSVGRAVPLDELAIVDATSPDLKFLSTGNVGEVVARGPNVMAGYLNLPELTEATVINGWLRTGDLGELDGDGYLYLRGRQKDMIITGGENVYAQEVELALVEHAAVDEVVVIGVSDDHWGEIVCALVSLRPGSEATEQELRQFCRTRLAGYKVPKAMVFRDSMPRLSSNKIDKVSLRSEYQDSSAFQPEGRS